MYDLIIQNGMVIDGSGNAGVLRDIAVKDGKIARIGTGLSGAGQYIDATGLVVCPGFIDSHSHGDLSVQKNPDHALSVQQGITFSVAGQCGGSAAPSTAEGRCSTMEAFMQELQDRPLAVNMGFLVGHGTLRVMVMGRENRAPTDEELSQMVALLEQCLDHGAIGMSLGLYYPPGSYAKNRELTAMAKVLGKRERVLVAHIRNESDQLLEAVEEFIELCRLSGCRGVISHVKAAEKANHSKFPKVLAMIEQARKDGLDIYADAYPYSASSTTLASRFVPRQFIPEGTTNPVSLLEDPAIRDKIRAWGMELWGTDLRFVLVVSCTYHPEYAGLNLNEIAQVMGHGDPYEAVFSILREPGQRCQCCFHTMSEDNVAAALAHPVVMIGTDANAGNTNQKYHPRRTGTFPRVLGRYVRERHITSLPEMIRKMTSLSAYVYGLPGKGRIAEGLDADICIFDPDTIRDTADYVNCASPNEGLRYVLIDGKIVLENDRYNGTRAGKAFAR